VRPDCMMGEIWGHNLMCGGGFLGLEDLEAVIMWVNEGVRSVPLGGFHCLSSLAPAKCEHKFRVHRHVLCLS
jgi:hypothetical protein